MNPANEFTVFAVLWPERGTTPADFTATLDAGATLTIKRPVGKTDILTLNAKALALK